MTKKASTQKLPWHKESSKIKEELLFLFCFAVRAPQDARRGLAGLALLGGQSDGGGSDKGPACLCPGSLQHLS